MLISIAILTVGCGAKPAGDFCDVSSPYRPSASAAAAMDRQDKQWVVSHNNYGSKACDWR